MDTHKRLRQLLNERGWTEYRLSKECGLSDYIDTFNPAFRPL